MELKIKHLLFQRVVTSNGTIIDSNGNPKYSESDFLRVIDCRPGSNRERRILKKDIEKFREEQMIFPLRNVIIKGYQFKKPNIVENKLWI